MSKLSQSKAIAKWQNELNKLIEDILNGDMTEGQASKYIIKESNKLLKSIGNSIDYEKDIKVAVNSYYKIYQKHVGKEVLDKQVRLAADYQKKSFNKLLKKLPKRLRESAVRDMRMVSNLLSSGQITQEAAVKQILKSNGGMTIATPKQGKWKLQTLLNKELRESLKQTCLDLAETIGDELGTDVYYVAGHAGAREGCLFAQEKFYHDGKDMAMNIDGNMEVVYNWSKSKYGIFPGLFDIFCRHMKFPVSARVSMADIYRAGEGSLRDLKASLESEQVLY